MTVAQGHQTVLLEPAVKALLTSNSGHYVDGTFGRGGHAARILEQLDTDGRLLAIDKDPEAVRVANARFAGDARCIVRHGGFASLESYVRDLGWHGSVHGVLLDLGVSSPQLDDAERGFSFSHDGPLDMRMNPEAGQSAEQWIANAAEAEIADVLYRYGDERYSRRIARAIVRERQLAPIERTAQLAEIIKVAHPNWEKHKHPATRSFQAIRIHVNSELEELQACLEQAVSVLRPGGRLVVISFHSLEDRMVKQFIRREEKGEDLPRGLPVMQSEIVSRLRRIDGAVKPQGEEVANNPRARSAVMRVAERTGQGTIA